MIGQLLRGLTGIANPVTKIAGAFIPNAEAKSARTAIDVESARAQFAAEFGHGKTWWDSLIDGINRLPRPGFAIGVMVYIYLSFGNPEVFATINVGLATIPEFMQWVILSVIGFYFTLRSGEKFRTMKASETMIQAVMADRAHEREQAVMTMQTGMNYDPEDSG